MTHDELLSILDAGVTNFPEDFQRYRRAIRSVVKLHNPMLPPNMPAWCEQCSYTSIDGNIVDWPCPTIQIIEKELANSTEGLPE